MLERYLVDQDTCKQLARVYQVNPETIRRRLARILKTKPPLASYLDIPQPCWLMTDATHFKRWGCLFVTKALGISSPLAVSFYDRECFETATKHLALLKNLSVSGYTTDGKKGLVLAHQQLFPQAGHQRCLVHIQMKVQTLLTTRPKLSGGKELLLLASKLTQAKSTQLAQTWWTNFCLWQERYQRVLNQRSYKGKSWWYTHQNLRGAWKHILNAADSLFVFLAYPNSVSHTNHLEGLFGQRKPALVRHRGLSRTKVSNALYWTFYFLNKT